MLHVWSCMAMAIQLTQSETPKSSLKFYVDISISVT